MSGTSGPTWREPSAYYDPETSCWKTSQGTFPWDSTSSSLTLPRSGMTRRGVLYELPMPALRTAAPESSSLLPTPVVNDMGAGKTPEDWDAWTERMRGKHGNGNGHGPSLAIEAARLLPTPEASDSTGGRVSKEYGGTRPSGAKRAITLSTTVSHRLLKTPTAQLGINGGSQHPNKRKEGGHGPTLADEVEHLLPTPTTQPSTGNGHARRLSAEATPHGDRTSPPSGGGSQSRFDELLDQLSLDELGSD